jgi:hypothetical protein
MSFQIHTFPSGSFDTLESSLQSAGFRVERSRSPGKKKLITREGIARAQIADYTEKKDSDVCFAVLSARRSIFSAISLWPIDLWLVRRVVRHLEAAGARVLDIQNEERA